MPILKSRLLYSDRRPQLQRWQQSRRVAPARCKLDSSTRLIAPAHTLSLPTLDGVKDRFEFSLGSEAAIPVARALIRRGLLLEKHLQGATSPVGALEAALAEIVTENFRGAQDEFDISVCISDRLEDYRKPEHVLFFTWSNSPDPQYIPLRPVFERLENNPSRDCLMASLYRWLYGAASKVFDAFGFDEAKNVYTWRKEWYAEARENGEDVDAEGEVEASDPGKVITPSSFDFLVGSGRWSNKLGGTMTLYFLLAYHFGLLRLTADPLRRYPGLSIIDLPPQLDEAAVVEMERFIVQPFLNLLRTAQFSDAQVILTGSTFEGVEGVRRISLEHVWT